MKRRPAQPAEPQPAAAAPERLPWMPWYSGTYLAETRGWPLIARAAYRELIDWQWEQGAIPADEALLRREVGATPTEWRVAWPLVAPKFPVRDGVRVNREVAALRDKQLAKRAAQREGAKLTNERLGRTGSDTVSVSVTAPGSDTVRDTHSESESECSPQTRNGSGQGCGVDTQRGGGR